MSYKEFNTVIMNNRVFENIITALVICKGQSVANSNTRNKSLLNGRFKIFPFYRPIRILFVLFYRSIPSSPFYISIQVVKNESFLLVFRIRNFLELVKFVKCERRLIKI
jgi:hypothetical protein